MLEEIQVSQPLGLRVMDRVRAFDTRRCEPAAGDKVYADRSPPPISSSATALPTAVLALPISTSAIA